MLKWSISLAYGVGIQTHNLPLHETKYPTNRKMFPNSSETSII